MGFVDQHYVGIAPAGDRAFRLRAALPTSLILGNVQRPRPKTSESYHRSAYRNVVPKGEFQSHRASSAHPLSAGQNGFLNLTNTRQKKLRAAPFGPAEKAADTAEATSGSHGLQRFYWGHFMSYPGRTCLGGFLTMAKDRPKDFDEGPETTFREAFPTIKNIRVEVVQSDSISWNPSEPRIYSKSNLEEYIECREGCQDGGFPVGEVVNEMEKRREIDRAITVYCRGREKRTHRRCKNQFSVEIHIDYSDAGQS